MAHAKPSRLWLGGVISSHRNCERNTTLVQYGLVICPACGHPSVGVGLVSYVTTFLRIFRRPMRIGHPGWLWLRCPSMRFSEFPRVVLADPSPLLDAQKRYPQRRVRLSSCGPLPTTPATGRRVQWRREATA
jgi:hypothetical protein